MDLNLVSLSQDVSFEDGSITNFLSLRTPLGQVIRAIVADDSAKLLFETLAELQHGGTAPPQPPSVGYVAPPPRAAAPAAEVDVDGSVIFGGDGGAEEGEEASTFWSAPAPAQTYAPAPQEPPPDPDLFSQDGATQATAYRTQQAQQKKRIKQHPMGTQNGRTVAKDSYGYPIVNGGSGVDPGEMMGSVMGGTVDDDGVGSI